MDHKAIPIKSVKEFVSSVSEKDTHDVILFRGQRSDEPMIPKIARLKFRDDVVPILENEKRILNEFKRLSRPHLVTYPRNDWEWLSLAQHHGLPTRLLDWSINALAALWFTVRIEPKVKNGKTLDGVLWMFFPNEDDFIETDAIENGKSPFTLGRTRLFQPSIVAQRINAQQGWFSIHRYDGNNGFIPFEKNKLYKKQLVKYFIDAKSFSQIRYDLDRFGINKFSLYPDLDGLAEHIQWLKSYMKDEET